MLKFIFALCLMAPFALMADIVYEDAEDQQTTGWVIFDNTPAAAVNNVFDIDLDSQIIELAGAGVSNAYRLGGLNASSGGWNDTSGTILSWQMNVEAGYRFYIRVDTTNGGRYLYYTASNSDAGLSGIYVRHGLGSDSISGQWQSYTRDLQADLTEFEPGNTIIAVQGLFVRGDMRIDDLALSGGTGSTGGGTDPQNVLPVANAGQNQTINEGDVLQLNGSGSTDNDGSVISFQWMSGTQEIASGESATVSDLLAGTYEITLMVTDNQGGTDTDQLTVTVIEVSNGAGGAPVVAIATGLLNDTGTVKSGSYPSGNSDLCLPGSTPAPQDCETGRDSEFIDGTLAKTGSGSQGFDFTKVDSSGAGLEESATQWSCVIDNRTGRMWEVKSNDLNSLHYRGDRFTHYDSNPQTNGGGAGERGANNDSCVGYTAGSNDTLCNTEAFVARVNSQGLCGHFDWRMPTPNEILLIVDHSNYSPAIDMEFFPATENAYYWTSTPIAANNLQSWNIRFLNGFLSNRNNTIENAVRLIRAE